MARWISDHHRLAIYLRDGLSCAYCGSTVEDGAELSLDHLQPRSKDGNNSPQNLVTCCRKCNTARGNRPVAEFAGKVAGYVGIRKKAIIKHINDCRNRKLPKAQASKMLRRRGTAFRALHKES
ncbi:MAG: HNH endonuclease [Chloroflexi bacterium]|jgi:5-methylcytosine-specific restriction endonuclease McrA|nr:HNH endonuclease [Chloroflexota bacterium]